MNIDEETLSQIKIEIEGISVKENFDAAIVNDEKNSIIFYADENNLIPMGYTITPLCYKRPKVVVKFRGILRD